MYPFELLHNIGFNSIAGTVDQFTGRLPAVGDSYKELRDILSFLDLTTLEGTDDRARVETLCRKALSFGEKGLPVPAAVCIYPPFIKVAKSILKGTPVKVAATAAAFPSGQLPIHLKVNEIRYVVEEGADEVDVVISRGTFLAGDLGVVADELNMMRKAASPAVLKVILETGELRTFENIAMASEMAIRSGADFIKTSTGKITPAATPEAFCVMLMVIRNHFEKTGLKTGIKAAGGIADPQSALIYYNMVKEIAGPEWLSPDLFRIGASRLADRIIDLM